MLACRVVCYPHQSHHCIRLYILHGSNCYIGVCILYQSDCHIRVYILHQSYHSIWISCTNHSIWVLLSCKWCHGIRGLCTKNDINQKFWAHLMSVMIVAYARASSNEVEIYLNKLGLCLFSLHNFKVKTCFFHSFSHNAHAKQLTFHHTLWKQHPKSNQKLPNHCTTWTLGNFLSAWIVFYQSNSILPH